MTSCAILGANLPLALSLDPGSGSRSSLGIVIIGGVFSSLVLTLVLVPVAYLWFAPNIPPEVTAPAPNGPARAPGTKTPMRVST